MMCRPRQCKSIFSGRNARSTAFAHRITFSCLPGTRAAGEPMRRKCMRFSGMSRDGLLPEMIEYENHPWFIGVQFNPELKSRPLAPHPLFASFVEAAVEQSRLV